MCPEYTKKMPKAGFEPARPCGHCALNAARLPVPPLRHQNIICLTANQYMRLEFFGKNFLLLRRGRNLKSHDPVIIGIGHINILLIRINPARIVQPVLQRTVLTEF